MIEKFVIKNFKCIVNAELDINNLTIFTGENSSGKSTALQAYLYAHLPILFDDEKSYLRSYCQNPSNINASPEKNVLLKLNDVATTIYYESNNRYRIIQSGGVKNEINSLKLLCANRFGPQMTYNLSAENSIGVYGEYAPSYFDINKYKEINDKLCINSGYRTLESQVNYWLNEIIGIKVKTEKHSTLIALKFIETNGNEFSAFDSGFGSSVVLPIIIMCLSCNIGDTVIIENPEIHLHPKAQAKLADFFAFIANAGIRVILETHCEHLIYKLCYNVYKKEISNENVTIYYKEKDNSLENNGYKKINISKGGRFLDANGEPCKFPSGFFDATAKQYLELF